MMTGLALAEDLESKGFAIQGPFARVDEALADIDREMPDCALLDVNLGNGRNSFPIADMLAKANVPFAFLTGYSDLSEEGARFSDRPRLEKPIRPEQAISTAEKLIRERRNAPAE